MYILPNQLNLLNVYNVGESWREGNVGELHVFPENYSLADPPTLDPEYQAAFENDYWAAFDEVEKAENS
jgi:hypothetical protein